MLGEICDDGCTITLEQQNTAVQNNIQKKLRGTRNKQTGMWEVTLLTKQSKPTVNNILAQTTKPELAKYFHAAIFTPTKISLLKAIMKGLPNTWPVITEG